MVSNDKANTSNEESTITNEPSKRRAETSVPVWQRRYKFVRDLNKGGMNKVTLVERCSDSLRVCVKFLKLRRRSENIGAGMPRSDATSTPSHCLIA